MQNKFSRDYVEQKDKEKEARAKRISELLPPRVTIPKITGEKHGLEYPDMRVFVFKVLLGAISVSVAICAALYYFPHH